jgi:hypothetical protein
VHGSCEILQPVHRSPGCIALSPRSNEDQSSARLNERWIHFTVYSRSVDDQTRQTKLPTHTLLPATGIACPMQTSLLDFLGVVLEFMGEIVVLVSHVDAVLQYVDGRRPNIRRGVYPKSCACCAGRCWLGPILCSGQSQILHRIPLQP